MLIRAGPAGAFPDAAGRDVDAARLVGAAFDDVVGADSSSSSSSPSIGACSAR
jgi:hypothetical protein